MNLCSLPLTVYRLLSTISCLLCPIHPPTTAIVARDAAVYVGAAMAPAEIGYDTNAAGGDRLVARLGGAAVLGGRYEVRHGVVAGALSAFAWLGAVDVRSEAGVEFPNHGKAPFLYSLEARLYPVGKAVAAPRLSPYFGAAFGGLLLSVDLDNINDQERRHLWARSLSAGVKMSINERSFIDMQVRYWSVLGRAPIAPFDVRSVLLGFGARY